MKEPINIQARPVEAPSAGLNLGDLYYILFRHKWKIVLVFLAGVISAAAFYVAKPPMYQSQAKILIRYILENKNAAPGDTDSQVKSPDSRGENIINSEIEILTSLDLAKDVVDVVGAPKVLAKLGGGADRIRAASVIRSGLVVEVPRRSNILLISFRHRDPAVVEQILTALLETYLKRHVAIHQGVGVLDDFYMRQADQLRSSLKETDERLKKLHSDSQILSLDDSKRTSIMELAKITEELRSAETELAERRTTLAEFGKTQPAKTGDTNAVAAIPAELSDEYRRVTGELEAAQLQLDSARTRYEDGHFKVRNLLQQVAALETRKKELVDQHPELTRLAPRSPDPSKPSLDLNVEALRVTGLEARVKVLTAQLAQARTNAALIIALEPELTDLQRKREADEANYRYYSTSLEKARPDGTAGAGKITNIGVVQTPSPPGRDLNELMKPMLALLALGCLGGFAWGFISDRFLNQTIKHVTDLERHLRVPLFVSVPDLNWRGNFRLPGFSRNGHPAPAPVLPAPNGAPETNGHSKSEIAPWDAEHKLRIYYEGLRDRLITFFEVRNMTHKPKLVAVTSCMHGAGATTMAAGLAATLSETGDGNVLLVDMNLEQGAAHQFYQGKPARGLSETLEGGNRADACVSENFYMVTAHETNNQKLPRVLPRRFANLVPKMKASDFDYIIFDMPPITQTSVTARLSGFMDMVLVVIESEKTGQEILKRAHGLLSESRANVAVVLNKHRPYVPRKLSQEL